MRKNHLNQRPHDSDSHLFLSEDVENLGEDKEREEMEELEELE